MAENKKSFIAYVDWKETFDVLPDEYAGKLIKHLFSYVNDEHPESTDVLINASFANIKQTLKRDLRKYEAIKTKRSESGKLGGRAKSKSKANKANALIEKQMKAKKADSVSVSDSVNVKEEIKIKYSDFVSMTESDYMKLVVEHGEKNTNTFITSLDNYKGSSGKKYKEDYRAILSWVIDDVKKKGKYEGQLVKPKFVF
jgi:hypothetical protein